MSQNSAIEWTEATWNPVTGCSKVSPGCAHCYAEGVALRFWATQYPPVEMMTAESGDSHTRPREFTDVLCHDDRLDQPLRWRQPRKVFVNSVSDLFHEDVPDAFIDRVFAVMALAPQHTFQVLTKRAERMRAYIASGAYRRVRAMVDGDDGPNDVREAWWRTLTGRQRSQQQTQWWTNLKEDRWPLSNVWLGVSVENQHFADERIPLLLQTAAAIRFISAEPLLEAVDLDRFTCGECGKSWKRSENTKAMKSCSPCCHHCDEYTGPDNRYWLGASPSARDIGRGLDWVIVGGESGAGARPFDIAWARSIVAQCKAAGVLVFVKQLGATVIDRNDAGFEGDTATSWPMNTDVEDHTTGVGYQGESIRINLSSRKGGDLAEWPEDLRVREMPTVNR